MWIRRVLLLAGVFLFLVGSRRVTTFTSSPIAPISSEGSFIKNGAIPGEEGKLGTADYWSSWDQHDEGKGRLLFAPLLDCGEILLEVRGYPLITGNELSLLNVQTGERLPLVSENPGESWREVRFTLPEAWRGATLQLVAVDNATAWGGWIAVKGIRAQKTSLLGTVRSVESVSVGVTLYALILLGFAGARRFMPSWLSDTQLHEILFSIILLGGLSIVSWWVYLVNSTAGNWTVRIMFLSLTARWIFRSTSTETSRRDVRPLLLLVTLAAIVYGAGSLLYHQEAPFYTTAAGRFLPNLPSDNTIPHYYASILRTGGDPFTPFGDWLSSDRPPLQTGWILLFAGVANDLGIRWENASAAAAGLLQLTWIVGAWIWLRAIGRSVAASTAILAAAIPTFIFALNSIFTWPKMAACGYLLIGYTLWFHSKRDSASASAMAGLAAGLAWLAHGGTAFALIGLVPLGLYSIFKAEKPLRKFRWYLVSACSFLALAIPWKLYQQFADPPGDRLLKWHLAGVVPIDPRSVGQVLTESYKKLSWSEIIAIRKSNLRLLFAGEWTNRIHPIQNAPDLRGAEQAYFVFSLGEWPLAVVLALATVFFRRMRARQLPTTPNRFDVFAAEFLALFWVLSTLGVWVGLMFSYNGTINHQGTYIVSLLFLLACASITLRTQRWLFGTAAAFHLAMFVVLWTTPPKPSRTGPPFSDHYDVFAASVLLVDVVVLIIVGWQALRAPETESEEPHAALFPASE